MLEERAGLPINNKLGNLNTQKRELMLEGGVCVWGGQVKHLRQWCRERPKPR